MATTWTFTPSEGPSSGTPFALVVLADNGLPRRSSPVLTMTKIPGGPSTVIDRGGPNLKQIDLQVRFDTGAAALAIEDLEGYQGTLAGSPTDLGGTLGHAPVILAPAERTSRGVNKQGPVVLAMTFIITGAPS